jgi:hypothetical protein
MITYKRKRVTSHVYTADGTNLKSSGASSSVPVSSLSPKYGVGADNNMLEEDNFVRNLDLSPLLSILAFDVTLLHS